MLHSIIVLTRICFMVGKPQDLPFSRELLAGCVSACFAVMFFGYSLLAESNSPIMLSIANTSLLGIAWYIILRIGKKTERWIQSACALFGSSSIVNLISLPIITGTLGEGVSTEASRLVIMGLWAWEIAVIGRIIQETVEVRTSLAILVSIALSIALQISMVTLFGTIR